MEKAILKTLIYAQLFDYPLLAYEINKWLIGYSSDLPKVEKGLEKLITKNKIEEYKDYYFLKGQKNLVAKRVKKFKQSKKYFLKVKLLSQFLKLIPWVKLVGISGGLSMENAQKGDDIDLFLITQKNRLWLSRLLSIWILDFLGVRRKRDIKPFGGKFCLNLLIDEEGLEQNNKDIYTAHEVLQMKVLWQRNNIYSLYLSSNGWAFEYLKNWATDQGKYIKPKKKLPKPILEVNQHQLLDRLELLAKSVQLKIMGKPSGMERVNEHQLYFHPEDVRPKILQTFRQKLKEIN